MSKLDFIWQPSLGCVYRLRMGKNEVFGPFCFDIPVEIAAVTPNLAWTSPKRLSTEIVRQRIWGYSATGNERMLMNNAIQLFMNE